MSRKTPPTTTNKTTKTATTPTKKEQREDKGNQRSTNSCLVFLVALFFNYQYRQTDQKSYRRQSAIHLNPPGGGNSHIKVTGMLDGKLKLNPGGQCE